MRKFNGFILLTILSLFVTGDVFSQSVWYTRYFSNIGGNQLRRVQFTTSLIGYSAGGNGTFMKTIDGGDTWSTISIGSNPYISSIFFLNQNTGWLGTSSSSIAKTTDGGTTWALLPIPTTSFTASLHFINDQTGFASSNGGKILKTVNGGTNWVNIAPSNIPWGEIQFLTENTGYVLQHYDVYRTTNSGVSWSTVLHNSGGINYFQEMDFINGATGWVTITGQIAKTTNAGDTWAFQPIAMNRPMAVKFLDENIGWCVGYNDNFSNTSGVVTATRNGGANWVTQTVIPNNVFWDVSFIDQNLGWASGNSSLSFTANGSLVSVTPVSTQTPDAFSLNQNYPNPFNPTTNIKFAITKSDFVTLKIYSMNGAEVKTVVNEKMNIGSYEVSFDAAGLTSGTYFYTLQSGEFKETKRMMLIK